MFKKRLLTIAVLLPLVLLAIFYLPVLWFGVLTALVVLWAAWEWTQFLSCTRLWKFLYMGFVLLGCVAAFWSPMQWTLFLALLIWLWGAVVVVRYAYGASTWGINCRVWRALLGALVLPLFWLALNVLRSAENGSFLVFFALLLVWMVDVGGFIAGKWFGRCLLAPRVSPKKTWEGFAAGVLLSVAAALVVSLLYRLTWVAILWVAGLALVTALFAVVGDLFESVLKRQAGLKDSGNLLPGHGGLLDRIDSALAAVPVFALGALWLGS